MTLTDLAKSYVRTIVPAVVGAVIAWALHHGHDIGGYEAQLTVVITGAYYGLARALEHWVSPRFGWLLGVATAPAYPPTPPAVKATKPRKKQAGHSDVVLLAAVAGVVLIVLLLAHVI